MPKRPPRAERLYAALLRLYPADFRREYGPAMRQLFGDCCRDAQRPGGEGMARLWLRALPDLLRRACIERLLAMRTQKTILPIALCAALVIGGWLGYADSRSDDTGITAGLLLVFGAVFGAILPLRAWLLALALGLCIPAANIASLLAKGRADLLLNQGLGSCVAVLFALVGAYIGVGLRRLWPGRAA